MGRKQRFELAPAPHIAEALPPDESSLTKVLEREPNRADVLFALGNLHLNADQAEKAAACYRASLKQEKTAGARCNLGVALLSLGQALEAVSELSQAVLQEPSLSVAHFHLGRAHLALDAEESAITAFEKVLSQQPGHAAALSLLAELFRKRGEVDAARSYYERALQFDPSFLEAEIWLGAEYFRRGATALTEDGLQTASAIWGEGFERYPRAFSAGQEILAAMKQRIEERRQQRKLKEAEQQLQQAEKEERADYAYSWVLELLFSERLLPDLHEPYERVNAALERWNAAVDGEVVFPYVHYRLGVLHAYRADFAESYEQLSLARDHLPASKQRALKIDTLIAAVRRVSDELLDDDAITPESASSEDWQRYGFADAFSREAWKQTGLHPREAETWRAAGFSPNRATAWEKERLLPDEAAYWRDAGFQDPKTAKRWHRAGFRAEEAEHWSELFSERIDTAIQSKQAGFDKPDEADRWLRVFMFPSEAALWREMGFEPAEAREWLANGISDPFVAKQAADAEQAAAESDVAESDGADSEATADNDSLDES